MASQSYVEAAQALRDNPGQWEAYESTGNCVVLAGPGSGKTKVLTTKLAKTLVEDIATPRGCACITFSNECARELRRRLKALGVQFRRNIFVGTIHSFCLTNIIAPYARLAGLSLPDPFTIATTDERDKLFEKAFLEVGAPDGNPRQERLYIDNYRRRHLGRDTPEWSQNEEYVNVIERYEELLRKHGLVDFDDMVLLGVRLVRGHPWVREVLKARFPVLFVDEYQDLGVALHGLVNTLCLDGGIRLFAVGDPDQSIYGFQGAHPELLDDLCKHQAVDDVVQLEWNYRCGKTIIEASEAALGQSRNYESKNGAMGSVDIHQCENGIEEQAKFICTDLISEAMERCDCTVGDIAVLYCTKYDGDQIASAAQEKALPFVRFDSGAPYRKTPLTRWLEDCASWCAGGWKSGSPAISELIRDWSSFDRQPADDRLLHERRILLTQFLFKHRDPHSQLREWLAAIHEQCLNDALSNQLLMSDEKESFLALAGAAKGPFGEMSVAAFSGQSGSPDHLNLITLHSAKGLEFEVVIMFNMDQDSIPGWRKLTPKGKKEKRRQFYVGLTRAKQEVHLTYSGWRQTKSGNIAKNGPSEFLVEVRKKLTGS